MRLVNTATSKGHAEHTLLRQSVRGNFHHRVGRAQAKRLVEKARQFERFRRGMRRGIDIASDVIFDRPDRARFCVRRRVRIDSIRNAVVLLPLVPVIPVTAMRSAGRL